MEWEVWRARDTKLGREVANKTLPEEFAKDADRLARFEREAKLLAGLGTFLVSTLHLWSNSQSLSGFTKTGSLACSSGATQSCPHSSLNQTNKENSYSAKVAEQKARTKEDTGQTDMSN